MQIQILSISKIDSPTKKGTTTPVLDIAFKNLTFQGKVEGKKLFSFGGNAGGFKVLQNAQSGEVYDITVIKNDAGYNDWSNAVKSDGAAPAASGSISTPSARPAAAGNAAPRSNYETPEERALRQIYIVRQSSLSTAVDVLTTGAKSPPSPDSVIDLAKQFENFVFAKEEKKADMTFGDLDTLAGDDFPDMPQ